VLSSTSAINNKNIATDDNTDLVSSIASTFYINPRQLQDLMMQMEELKDEINAVLNSRYKELLFS